jgi:uncharacterized FlgJ-related protein
MKFYKFCDESFTYKPVNALQMFKKHYPIFILLIVSVGWLSIKTFQVFLIPKISLREIPEINQKYEKILIAEEENKFTEDKFIHKLKEINIKFPHIVLAQAYLESDYFTSKMFLENNNMFGMKEAKARINLASGTQCGHAYFYTWEECLLDYAYYRATYTFNIKTEQQFYEYLNNYYAEDPNYESKLKNIVKKHNLKSKFT